MRILILTQFFEPEPVLMNVAFAKALAEGGHEVRVLTGFPNYPGGKVYDGYKIKLRQREVIDGVTVVRVPLYPSHSKSKLGRIANYIGFGAAAAIAGTFSRWRPDAIFVYHPPLTVGIAAAIIGWLRRVPFIYNVQDLWPDTLKATGMIHSDNIIGLVGKVASHVYRRAAMLVPQSPGFTKRLFDRGVPSNKLYTVINWADEQALAQSAAWNRPAALQEKFLVTFAGTMGAAQGLDTVVEAARILQANSPDVRFLMIGGGIEKERLQAIAPDNMVFLPAVPMQEIGGVLQASDALLVHLRPDPLFAITIPSKTQAYLHAGKPILMGVAGDAAMLVEQAQAGLTFEPGNAAALADAISQLVALTEVERAAMGQRGRSYYDRELAFSVGTRAIRTLLEGLQTAK